MVKPHSIADQKARMNGFALNLANGGCDADDADFARLNTCPQPQFR